MHTCMYTHDTYARDLSLGSIVETILYSNINLIVTEVGGGDENRPSWSSYYPNTEGVNLYPCTVSQADNA